MWDGKIWDRWFQIWLGEELCKWAEEQAKAELGTADERAEQGLAPHWLSQQKQRPPQGHVVKPFPENHQRFNTSNPGKHSRIKISSTKWCVRCLAVAKLDGYRGWFHNDGRDKDYKVQFNADGSLPSQSVWACTICKKTRLCFECFRMEDEHGSPLPGAWDHDWKCLMARPCDSVMTG